MVDLSKTIEPKSDQTSADDLVAGPRTIQVTGVEAGTTEQPIIVHYKGDNGRPYKPCKSMRRLMVKMWGKNGDEYAGKSMTLFCDPTVTFGADAVGGIRISHMSHIERDETIMLTASRGKKKPYQVRRLKVEEPKPDKPAGNIKSARTTLKGAFSDDVETLLEGLRGQSWTEEEGAEIKRLAAEAKKRTRPQPAEDGDGF